MKKMQNLLLVTAVMTLASGADALAGRDYSGFDEDTTAVVYGAGGTADAAYFYGFEVNPTTTNVNLDGVSSSVGDFHPLNAPTFDLANGIAHNAGAAGGEALMRTDFTGSLWREQFQSIEYTIEAKVNLLGTGTEGAEGVFGLFSGNDLGRVDIRIGTTFVRDDIAGVNLASGIDNTGWHVWRVSMASGGFYLYRDGVQIGDPISPGSIWNRSFAGDYSSTLSGDWEMEYYVLDTEPTLGVPEPSAFALIGLGGLVMALRRRR